MAPHNATYPALKQLLAAAEIVVPESMPSSGASNAEQKRVNAIQQRLGHFSKPILMRVPKQSISLQSPIEFMKMSLPKKFLETESTTPDDNDGLFLCPQEFDKMLTLRQEKFAHLQAAIKSKGLTQE
jgi:hypothetical protein